MGDIYKIIKNKSNNIEIFATINNKKILMGYLKKDKKMEKKNINLYILTLGEEATILIESVLIFARKYIHKLGGMIRIDGDQYVSSIRGDVLNPLRKSISSLTNIYIEKDGKWIINTVTNEEIIKIRSKNINIKYAPMNNTPYNKVYNIYRIFDCGKSIITCERVNEKFSLSPWIIIERMSSMMNELSIETTNNTAIHGLAIEDINGSIKNFSPPKLNNVKFEGKYLRLHLTGESANILNTSYGEIRKSVGKQIYLSGVDTIYGLMVDMEIFSVLRDISRTEKEKETYKKIIEMSVKNNVDNPILPFWKWVFIWNYKNDPDVIAIKCRENDIKGIKTKDLVKYIMNNRGNK